MNGFFETSVFFGVFLFHLRIEMVGVVFVVICDGVGHMLLLVMRFVLVM